jgi:hypothetical protein
MQMTNERFADPAPAGVQGNTEHSNRRSVGILDFAQRGGAERNGDAADNPSLLVGTTRARGAQALGARPLSKGELGWQRGARCDRSCDALGHRRTVLEAMARSASHDPYAWLVRVWSCEEVRVRRDLVSTRAAAPAG